MLLELSHAVEQLIARHSAMMGISPEVYIERLVLADEQDAELARLAERLSGCETPEQALQNGVEVPPCDDAQDFLAWRAGRHQA